MSFWTGLEAFTGHRPGAFTGMTMKDLFDKDMWDRLPRTWSGKMGTPEHLKANPMDRMLSRGGEPMMTNWYNRNAGTAAPAPVNEWVNPNTQASPVQMNQLGTAQVQTRPLAPRPDLNPQPVPGWTPPRNPAEVIQETGRYYGMGDPYSGWGGYIGSAKNAHMGMGASGYKVSPVPQFDSTMADMTTVKKITDDASPNTITQTIKQKVPANPTNTLMNMGRKIPIEDLGLGSRAWSNPWRGKNLDPGFAMPTHLQPWKGKNLDSGFYMKGPWGDKNLDPGFAMEEWLRRRRQGGY